MAVPEVPLSGGPLRVAISNALSQILVDYTGRGAQRTRTAIIDDTVLCFFHGSLNRAERKLADAGKGALVIEIRRSYQDAMSGDFVSAVTRLTDRPVVAFMSDHSLDPDVAVEIFLLEAANAA